MKKIFALVLTVCFILSVCGCKNNTETNSTTSSNIDSGTSTSTNSYKDIKQRDIHSINWNTVCFTHKSSDNETNLVFPDDWKFEKQDNIFNIIRDGKKIGTVTDKPIPLAEEKFEALTKSVNGLKYNREIHKNGNKFTYVLSCGYTADTKTLRVTVEVDYAELCNAAVTRMINDSMLFSVSDSIRGDFTLNGGKKIMVCGNSFIGTSQIAQWFNQMCTASQNGYRMNSYSAGTLASGSDESITTAVKQGEYAAILLCGFYGDSQYDKVQAIKKLCKESDTRLVIFPAHNEVQSLVDKALTENPDVSYIGWKQEIQNLIDFGVDYDKMCIDDAHQHTTHLGGYVGAQMVYRALFKKLPPTIEGTPSCSFSTVKSDLGNYVTTGDPYSVRGKTNVKRLSF